MKTRGSGKTRAALALLGAAVLVAGANGRGSSQANGRGSSQANGPLAKKYGPIAWNANLTDARKIATKQNKIVLVDFYAEWCSPCKEMLATTYKEKDVVTQAAHFTPVLLDIDKYPAVAQKYNVSAIPTVVFLDAKGRVLVQSEGYHKKDEFLKLMAEAEKKAKQKSTAKL